MESYHEYLADYNFNASGEEWRIKQGRERLEIILTHVDEDEKARVMQEQIDVVGGSSHIYELVDGNLRKSLIEHSLWKETLDLYRWRKIYFGSNLPSHESWFSNASKLNTISYQITKNFEQVVDICCCSTIPKGYSWPDLLYLGVSSVELEEDKMAKRLRIVNLDFLFHANCFWSTLFCEQRPLSDIGLRYGDVPKTLFAHYGVSPPRLEELAMKAVKKEDRIASENLIRPVKENDDWGFFQPETFENDMKNLSKVGQARLRRWKELHHDRLTKIDPIIFWPYSPGSITMSIFKDM